MATSLLIVGFGNTLMADDGVGPAVIDALRGLALPDCVRIEHGGSDALSLFALWRGEGEVWLVDALIAGAPPGTLHRLGHDEVMTVPQRHGTVHRLSLPECLRWLALGLPEMDGVRYSLWGVEPQRIEPHPGLTPAVANAVAPIATAIAAAARSD